MRGLLMVAALTSCASVPSEIQGTWTASGELGGRQRWNKEYVVDGDGFEMDGYPPISERCDLELVTTEGTTHRLRATGCVESGPGPEEPGEDHEVKVEVLADGIRWDGQLLRRKK